MTKQFTVKALGDWQLDVLGVPYGGRDDLDADGEYFSSDTKLHPDKYPAPPVVYYHGYTPDGQPSGTPEYIGKTVARERRADGVWFRVVLDKASEYARRVWEAAKEGIARASSGAVSHLSRTDDDGHIREWPMVELSLFDIGEGRKPANSYAVAIPVLKAVYKQAGLDLPDNIDGDDEPGADVTGFSDQSTDASASGAVESETTTKVIEVKTMNENEHDAGDGLTIDSVKAAVAEMFEEQSKAQAAEQEAKEQHEAEVKAAVAAEREKWEAEHKAANRLPFTAEDAPLVGQFGELRRYDDLDAGDVGVMVGVLKAAGKQVSEHALRALAVKVCDDKSNVGERSRRGMKAYGMPTDVDKYKANEINYATLASYGDDWVGITYSAALWESIRTDTPIAAKIPSVVVPQGSESIYIPLESTDPVFYHVAEVVSDEAATNLSIPLPTVRSSRMGTTDTSLAVNKMGARTRFSGELSEDSFIPWASQLRVQLASAGAETFEHVIIDGDTAATASTNINDIAGTADSYDAFLLFNGFRKLALVTNTNNARSGGAIDENDYILTMKLLGAAGKNADQTKCAFIVDPNVYWKSLEGITAIKTKDVWGNATLEGGMLTSLWGYPVFRSYSFHWNSRNMTGYEYKANTAGKIDEDTSSNNTTGSLLAVRWDQWLLGFKRRMTIETTRVPNADYTEIVALMRVGMINRDNEAAAISYNLTV